jgi:hypothetical protein
MVTLEAFDKANETAREMESRMPKAVSARYDRHIRRVVVQLSSNLASFFLPATQKGWNMPPPSN